MSPAVPKLQVNMSAEEIDSIVKYQLCLRHPRYLDAYSLVWAGVVQGEKRANRLHKLLVAFHYILAPPGRGKDDLYLPMTVDTNRINRNLAHNLSSLSIAHLKRLVCLLFFWEEELNRWRILEAEGILIREALASATGHAAQDLAVALKAVELKKPPEQQSQTYSQICLDVPKKENYRFGITIGSGTFGLVREDIGPVGKVAIKIIRKDNPDVKREHILNEVDMLQTLKHPHIIKFIEWFESNEKYYIVTELAEGGELFNRISKKGRFTEKEASQTIKQVLHALDFLHRKDVVYRDIKPENILYLRREKSSDLVLADLGLAKATSPSEVLQTVAGSLGYAAPEVMSQGGYGKPADMWALGVLTYQLLCGYLPFRSESFPGLLNEIVDSGLVFHETYWKGVSDNAKAFVMSLIQVDPMGRATSYEAIAHPWLCSTVAQSAADHQSNDYGPHN